MIIWALIEADDKIGDKEFGGLRFEEDFAIVFELNEEHVCLMQGSEQNKDEDSEDQTCFFKHKVAVDCYRSNLFRHFFLFHLVP